MDGGVDGGGIGGRVDVLRSVIRFDKLVEGLPLVWMAEVWTVVWTCCAPLEMWTTH